MTNDAKIDPQVLRGFQDFTQPEMIQREWMIGRVKQVYESFGYDPIETPILEDIDILGCHGDSTIYEFLDPDGRQVGMRYDLTVPLAAFIARHRPRMPFKRYHTGPVFRGEKPQKGRFRQFAQFDADICGSSSMLADAEIVYLIYSVMTALGLNDFVIEINNRKVLDGMVKLVGIEKCNATRVFRAVDKLPKIGYSGVYQELITPPFDDHGDPLPAFTLDVVDMIMDFITTSGENGVLLTRLGEKLRSTVFGAVGIGELAEVISLLKATGVDETKVRINPSIARGLDYYTGTVFETTLTNLNEFGSVFSGGRFDKLIGQFLDYDIPAVGASVGVDRLFEAMQELRVLPKAQTLTEVLVTVLPENPIDSLKVANILREGGINTEVFPNTTKMGKQIEYADKRGIPFVIICFQDYLCCGKVVLRRMFDSVQTDVCLEQLVSKIQQLS